MRRPDSKLPEVPRLGPARAFVWVVIAASALVWRIDPGGPPPLHAARAGAGCELAPVPGSEPCACSALPARLRLLMGFPIPLNRASVAALQAISGLGPSRASAIVAERERGGEFADTADLVRVRGIGERTASRLRAQLFVGPVDPACLKPALL